MGPLPQLTLAGQGTFLGVLPTHRAALDAALHELIVVKSRFLVAVHGLWRGGGEGREMITEPSAHPPPPQGLGSQVDGPSSLLWQAQGGICPLPEALITSAGLQVTDPRDLGWCLAGELGKGSCAHLGAPACCSQSCCCCPGLAQLFGTHQKLNH